MVSEQRRHDTIFLHRLGDGGQNGWCWKFGDVPVHGELVRDAEPITEPDLDVKSGLSRVWEFGKRRTYIWATIQHAVQVNNIACASSLSPLADRTSASKGRCRPSSKALWLAIPEKLHEGSSIRAANGIGQRQRRRRAWMTASDRGWRADSAASLRTGQTRRGRTVWKVGLVRDATATTAQYSSGQATQSRTSARLLGMNGS